MIKTTKRNTMYSEELNLIETIAACNPEAGPYALATRIDSGEFGNELFGRSFYSILSVIRRYRAKQQQNQPVTA